MLLLKMEAWNEIDINGCNTIQRKSFPGFPDAEEPVRAVAPKLREQPLPQSFQAEYAGLTKIHFFRPPVEMGTPFCSNHRSFRVSRQPKKDRKNLISF
ncbi:MAG: hypothetical protein HGB20_06610 [Chlorobiaceae bacterium]|nr:hypothetical protein [Chlorobiaceae bacterium]